jgi:hypothetical protein
VGACGAVCGGVGVRGLAGAPLFRRAQCAKPFPPACPNPPRRLARPSGALRRGGGAQRVGGQHRRAVGAAVVNR